VNGELTPLVPAKAGTQNIGPLSKLPWIPAFAGMSGRGGYAAAAGARPMSGTMVNSTKRLSGSIVSR
jgi:hypothetical protein